MRRFQASVSRLLVGLTSAAIATTCVATVLVGCAPKDKAEPTKTPSLDAGAALDAAATGTAPVAPVVVMGDYHLDESPTGAQRSRRVNQVAKRQIEIILRSTPPGAMAAVDGQPIGKTPTFWNGVADGRAHDFTFSLPGHAVSRYRFVSTRNGIVHGTLRRLLLKIDAGPQ